jgi:hypothetical protein
MGASHFLDTRVPGGAGAVQLEAAMEGLAASGSGSAGKEPGQMPARIFGLSHGLHKKAFCE